MSDTPLGRFSWFDLMTPEPEVAPLFYGPVAGWRTMPFEGGEKPYLMWTNGEQPIGGMIQLPDEAIEAGAPPHWLAYVSTPDVKATAQRARELGGAIMTEMEIPDVGFIAVIIDPQGAIIAAYQPTGDAPGHDGPPEIGEFSWHELMTEDWQAAWAFYSQLFGWEEESRMDLGEMGTYQIYQRAGVPLGGMMNKPPEMPSAWLYYIRVADLDAALEHVETGGGRVLNGPMEVPGGDRVAQCLDAQGAAFALHATGGV